MIVSSGLTVPVAVTLRITGPRVTGAVGIVNGAAAAQAKANTVHFSTLIAFFMSIGGGGLSVRRRNGKLLILRLTPRGLRRLRLEETSSSRISLSTAS